MEKSIENIWTKGFLKEEKLAVPRINNLYQRKSRLLIEELKRTYRVDNRSIIPLTLIFVVGFSIAGHVLLGLYFMILMLTMFFLNKKKLKSLEEININTTTYDYLIKYRKMFFQLKKFYTRLLGFGLPIAGIIGYYLFFRNAPVLEKILQLKALYIVAIVLALSGILATIGILSYLLSVRLIYGKFIRRLDDMIADMEDLQQ